MIYLYLLASVLTDGFLTYLIYRYYHLLYPVAKLSKRIINTASKKAVFIRIHFPCSNAY